MHRLHARYLATSDVERSGTRYQHCRLASIANARALYIHIFIRIINRLNISAKSPLVLSRKARITCSLTILLRLRPDIDHNLRHAITRSPALLNMYIKT
jgi:hypothetical protein